MKTLLIFALFFTQMTCIFGQEISRQDESQALEHFFKHMFESSEYGYVFEGAKPLAIMNISPVTQLIAPQSKRFRSETYAREVMAIWKKLALAPGEVVLKFTPKSDGDIEVLFINVETLKAEIDANINLFKYALGPTVESEDLVEKIVSSEAPLHSILCNDRVLEGIVLGFGAFNSLMHSRVETIQNVESATDSPPFIPNNALMKQPGVFDYDEKQQRVVLLNKSSLY